MDDRMVEWMTSEKQPEAHDAIESGRGSCQVPAVPGALSNTSEADA